LLLYVAIEFRLYLHLAVSGVRGWIIVGTHHLVVRPFRKLKPFLTWYGIVYLRVSPFNPIRKLCLRVNLHTQTSPIKDVGPSRNHAILTINQRLVEVETVALVLWIYHFQRVDYISIRLGCRALIWYYVTRLLHPVVSEPSGQERDRLGC